jgi:hypothetical protein
MPAYHSDRGDGILFAVGVIVAALIWLILGE